MHSHPLQSKAQDMQLSKTVPNVYDLKNPLIRNMINDLMEKKRYELVKFFCNAVPSLRLWFKTEKDTYYLTFETEEEDVEAFLLFYVDEVFTIPEDAKGSYLELYGDGEPFYEHFEEEMKQAKSLKEVKEVYKKEIDAMVKDCLYESQPYVKYLTSKLEDVLEEKYREKEEKEMEETYGLQLEAI